MSKWFQGVLESCLLGLQLRMLQRIRNLEKLGYRLNLVSRLMRQRQWQESWQE
jgi:hypothetical protein